MKQLKVLFLISFLLMPLCSTAMVSAAVTLDLSDVALPCAKTGASAEMPVVLTTGGATVAGVSADIKFDAEYLTYVGCTIGPAGTAAGKTVTAQELATPGVVRIGVYGEGSTAPIGDGIIAMIHFTLKKNPVRGISLTANTCDASDAAGTSVAIDCTSAGKGGVFFTTKTGDVGASDGKGAYDGTVDMAELLQVVGMFLGAVPVDPVADPDGDGKVEINDLIQAINCYLETADCKCTSSGDTGVPQADLWATSGHADTSAMAFNDWNECTPVSPATTCTPEVPASCAKCHSTPGYLDYLGADGTAYRTVNKNAPIGSVITCEACHNEKASELTSVVFESTGILTKGIQPITITGLGAEARCMVCHQGRQSSVTVNDAITAAAVATVDTPSTTGTKLSFKNVHYMGAAATQYGKLVAVGYQYTGKTYDGKFAHVEGYDTCITCHDPHSLEVRLEKCVTCHTGATTNEALHDIRMKGSLVDYDGDGNTTEGVYYEIQGLQAKLMQAIQAYATQIGTPIVYNEGANPYWFKASDGTTSYAPWTPRLLKAAYNYQFSIKDKGAYAHGGKYVIELLYDSIEDLNVYLTTKVDLSTASRNDEGHFNGSSEPWRHWDANPAVPYNCARCHSGEGIPFFLTNNVNISEPQANGMMCVNCHTSVTDTVAPRRAVASVPFPSGLSASLGDDSNLCLLCHQGRESTKSVDAMVAGAAPYSNMNTHYFAAGATLLGTDVKVAYEYSGKTYAGKNTFPGHGGKFDTCVECHMGTKSLNPAYRSHNVTKPNNNNCVCHFFDVSQPVSGFEFGGIRKTAVDYNANGIVTESLQSEIQGLETALYAQIRTYASTTLGKNISYDAAAYPYWYIDTNNNGVHDTGETTGFGKSFDAKLLKASYNFQFSKKDPAGYIHNAQYIAQILVDSIADLGGDVSAYTWR